MKNAVFILFLFAATCPLFAQEFGASINLGLRKTLNFDKKSSLELRQQFQFTPEIEKYNNKFGDFFNEDGFWPVPDRYRDDDDLDDDNDNDDDDDDDDLPPGAGSGTPVDNGELNDTPHKITLDWRSTSSFQYNFRPAEWFRTNTGYGFMFDGEDFRHTFRAELDYRPLRHLEGKRKLDLAARTLFQHIGQRDDGKMEWNNLLTPRFDVSWAFDKKHTLTLSNALNGGWDDGIFEFDRWRVNAALAFTYKKIHRFTLAYQYQQRIGKSSHSQGLSFAYEIRF
ncbi:MAG: hypothetical protein OHK0019_29870 [Saprospiraceae bacterium]